MTIHFTSSVVKITKEGDKVLSSVLHEGEALISGQGYDDVLANGIGTGTHTEEIETETMTLNETGTSTVGGETTVTQTVPDEPDEETPESENHDLSPEEQGISETGEEDGSPIATESDDEEAPVADENNGSQVDTTPEPTDDGPAVSATPTDPQATNDDTKTEGE